MTTTEETRTTSIPVECRVSNLGTSRMIGGRAIAFGKNSKLLPGRGIDPPMPGGFYERVVPSFCDGARAEDFKSIVVQYNHDPRVLLGRVDNDTAGCSVDDLGLDYWCDCPDWGHPPNVPAMVQRGDLRHSSFTFSNAEAEWSLGDDGIPLRTLTAGDISEVSPVVRPAYVDSTVALRGLATLMDAPYEDIAALAESRSLHKLFTRTDRPAPAKTSRQELVDNLSQQYPEVRFFGKDGKAALAETMAASPAAGAARSRQKLLQTLAEHPGAIASRVTPWEARRRLTEMATPPIYATIDVSIAEYKAIAEIEASRKRLAEVESRSAEVTRPPEPPRRTLTGHEALRILDGMRPALPYETAESAGLDENY
jgi:uncharacterized protein